MKIPWKSIAIYLAGIITGFLVLIRVKKPDKVVTAETYVEDQEQRIGKIKQKGEGNGQQVQLKQELSRKEKRASRKAERKSRKSK
ncbi:hypothetical protein [uncultured Draconibacterium sp.]|uniref:hypothetical protein n=1 Tax=uncultured Draconibacterium sp. TaxID=1573823 RepID=UPI0029C97F7F|nr:hypothetical protein [uncultured Draconibacterium sp.]